MPPKPKSLRKKRATLKADEATQFLRDFLADGRKSWAEVELEARRRGISLDTLRRASADIVDKRQEKGPDGPRVSYWSLLPPTPRPRKSKAAVLEETITFKSGYERAVNDMLWRLASIAGEHGKRKTARHLFERFSEELRKLKPK